MRWKFWQKPEASTASHAWSSINWPADACDSLRALAALYLRDVHRFTEWRAEGFAIESGLESLFRRTVKAHQLHVWFALYLAQRGEVEAKMLRDALPHVMDELEPNEEMGDRIHNLLEAQSCAVDYFSELSAEEKAAAADPPDLESTLEWHLAFYLLVFNPDSPFVEPDEVPDGQQHALAACLRKASHEAQSAFEPMLMAIERFDPARLAGWEWWSQTMGPRERHLQRRHQNPIFAPQRHIVTASDLYPARLLDAREYDEVFARLKSIGGVLADFKPRHDWATTLNDMKKELEALQRTILGMDRRGDDLRRKVEVLRGHAVGYMRDLLEHFDPAQLSRLDEAEGRGAQFMARHPCDWSWQVYRGDVIPDDEAVQALLCESSASIAQVAQCGEASFLSLARAEAAELARTLRAAGHEIPELDMKLRALGLPLRHARPHTAG